MVVFLNALAEFLKMPQEVAEVAPPVGVARVPCDAYPLSVPPLLRVPLGRRVASFLSLRKMVPRSDRTGPPRTVRGVGALGR